MWLAEGRTIDHSTICKFRTRFKQAVEGVVQAGRPAGDGDGVGALVEVAFDGTRVKANASRFHTWTAERVEAALKELEALFEQAHERKRTRPTPRQARWRANGAGALPPELADGEGPAGEAPASCWQRLQAADAARKKDGHRSQKNPAQLPKADTDSTVMPNKEGGYAPNYTPVAATDGAEDCIVDCDVIAGPNEARRDCCPAWTASRRTSARSPAAFLADTAFGTGANLEGMEQRQVEFYTPGRVAVAAGGQPGEARRSAAAGAGGGLGEAAAERQEEAGQVVLRVRCGGGLLLLSAWGR